MKTLQHFTVRVLGLMGVMLMSLNLSAVPVEEYGLFELDGNAIDEAVDGDDWDSVLDPDYEGAALATTGLIADGKSATIFFQGGSKDTNDISKWRWKNGSVPDKDDITNAYAVAYLYDNAEPDPDTQDLVVFVGADRFANTGDAVMGLWLFQNDVGPTPDGKFSGVHAIGDLLAIAEFSNGGHDVDIVLYRWAGLDAQGKGILTSLPITSALCNESDPDSRGCAISNTSPTPSPWNYTPKAGPSGTFPSFSFFEAGLNFSALAREFGFNIPCFSSFMVQTRSSTSLNAQLKDFVLGSFETCKLSLTKECPSGDINATETGFVYNYNGTVTNGGFGTLYDVLVVDNAGTPGDTSDDIEHAFDTLGPGASADYSGSFTSLLNPPTNSAQAFAKSSAAALQRTVNSEIATDTCPQIDKDPMISVTKTCEPYLDTSSGQVVVGVGFSGMVCNTGDITLNNITVSESIPNVTFTDAIVSSLGKLGSDNECDTYAGYYFPSDSNESTAVPGDASFSNTITVSASAPLGFGGAISEPATATCELCPE